MRKIAFLTVALTIAGCGGDDGTETPVEVPDTGAAETAADPTAVDTGMVDNDTGTPPDTTVADTGSADTGSAPDTRPAETATDAGSDTRDAATAADTMDSSTAADTADSAPAQDTQPLDVYANFCGETNPCQNGGSCANGSTTYACTCAPGYSGTNCETNIDECAGSPCLNGGTCTDGVDSFSCACVAGYTGTTCQTNIDDCSPNPCLNSGVCTDGVNSFTCACAAGFTGTTCATNTDECGTVNPCQNGGTCVDGINEFTCNCPTGYTGTTCQTVVSDCAAANPCQNGGTCTDIPTPGSYTCACTAGFWGPNCAADCIAPNCNSSGAIVCNQTTGAITSCATCNLGLTGPTCSTYFTSCKTLKAANPTAPSGTYTIDPDGAGAKSALAVHCDMVSDGGIGYTMLKVTDAVNLTTGGGKQTAYKATCSALGLEIIVPRTKAHGIAIRTYNGGSPPNVVGVYPKVNGNAGLSNWTGKCGGANCDFYLSDNNFMGVEPNGNNNTNNFIYRWSEAITADNPLSTWDDADDTVFYGGYVLCSTNDAGPDTTTARASCDAWAATNTVWNRTVDGIDGAYAIDPDGAGGVAATNIWCDHRGQADGSTHGWMNAAVVNSSYSTTATFDQVGAANFQATSLDVSPRARSAGGATGAAGWLNLNTLNYTRFQIGAYNGGNQGYLSPQFTKATRRINFGLNGYYLWNAVPAADATGGTYSGPSFYWCGGQASYTDLGSGQIDKPEPTAPNDCKNHGGLGSGWDFSQSGVLTNQCLTMTGGDVGQKWMYGSCGGNQVFYANAGAAQAIWVR